VNAFNINHILNNPVLLS